MASRELHDVLLIRCEQGVPNIMKMMDTLASALLNSFPFPQLHSSICLGHLLFILIDRPINFAFSQSSTLIFYE